MVSTVSFFNIYKNIVNLGICRHTGIFTIPVFETQKLYQWAAMRRLARKFFRQTACRRLLAHSFLERLFPLHPVMQYLILWGVSHPDGLYSISIRRPHSFSLRGRPLLDKRRLPPLVSLNFEADRGVIYTAAAGNGAQEYAVIDPYAAADAIDQGGGQGHQDDGAPFSISTLESL